MCAGGEPRGYTLTVRDMRPGVQDACPGKRDALAVRQPLRVIARLIAQTKANDVTYTIGKRLWQARRPRRRQRSRLNRLLRGQGLVHRRRLTRESSATSARRVVRPPARTRTLTDGRASTLPFVWYLNEVLGQRVGGMVGK